MGVFAAKSLLEHFFFFTLVHVGTIRVKGGGSYSREQNKFKIPLGSDMVASYTIVAAGPSTSRRLALLKYII